MQRNEALKLVLTFYSQEEMNKQRFAK